MIISQLISSTDFKEKHILKKLLIEYLQISREEIRSKGDLEIPEEIYEKIVRGYKLATEEKMPLDYVIGHVSFFGKEFVVNQDTLVPRPETEYMIQAVSEYIQSTYKLDSDLILMDIGTGSGVLGTSVLLQNPDNIDKVFFTDISDKALLIAKHNVDKHLVGFRQEMFFIWTDLLAFVDSYKNIWLDKNIILVANLPYIPEQMFDQNSPENVQKREPRVAFVGGEDGLIYYRQLLDQMPENMRKKTVCFFEMMTRQLDILSQEYQKNWCFEEIKTFHFNIRIIKATYKN